MLPFRTVSYNRWIAPMLDAAGKRSTDGGVLLAFPLMAEFGPSILLLVLRRGSHPGAPFFRSRLLQRKRFESTLLRIHM
jgi:hypothetical protein